MGRPREKIRTLTRLRQPYRPASALTFNQSSQSSECFIPLSRNLIQVATGFFQPALLQLPHAFPSAARATHQARLFHNPQCLVTACRVIDEPGASRVMEAGPPWTTGRPATNASGLPAPRREPRVSAPHFHMQPIGCIMLGFAQLPRRVTLLAYTGGSRDRTNLVRLDQARGCGWL